MRLVDKRGLFGARRLLMWKSLRTISLKLRHGAIMLSKMNNAMRRELIPTEGTPPKSPDPEHGVYTPGVCLWLFERAHPADVVWVR